MASTSEIIIWQDTDLAPERVVEFLGRSTTSDPDVLMLTDEKSIKIEPIRDLQVWLSTTAQAKEGKLVVIAPADRLTREAQQALLKILEEPPENTSIVLATRTPRALLPTIHSRCIVRVVAPPNNRVEGNSEFLKKLAACSSWKEAVLLTQELPTKRVELEAILVPALAETSVPKVATIQQFILTALEALRSNVSPALVGEWLVYSVLRSSRIDAPSTSG